MSGSGDIKITKDGNVLLHEMVTTKFHHFELLELIDVSLFSKFNTQLLQDEFTGDGTTSTVLIIGNSHSLRK